MPSRLRALLHGHQRAYLAYRYVRVWLVRMRYGLRRVHWTSLVIRPRHVSRDLRTGAYCSIGHGAWIGPRVRVGNYVLIAPDVAIVGGDHVFDVPGTPISFTGRPAMPETLLEDDVWIGQRVLIKAGVRIGRGAIVAMGSVVTKDVPPYTVVGGVPACVIRRRFATSGEEEAHDRRLNQPVSPGRFCVPKHQD